MLYLKGVGPQYSNCSVDFLFRVFVLETETPPDELYNIPLEHVPVLLLLPPFLVVVHQVLESLPLVGPVVSVPEESQHGDAAVLVSHSAPAIILYLDLVQSVPEGLALRPVERSVPTGLGAEGEPAVVAEDGAIHPSEALEADSLRLVVGTHHGWDVLQYQLDNKDEIK